MKNGHIFVEKKGIVISQPFICTISSKSGSSGQTTTTLLIIIRRRVRSSEMHSLQYLQLQMICIYREPHIPQLLAMRMHSPSKSTAKETNTFFSFTKKLACPMARLKSPLSMNHSLLCLTEMVARRHPLLSKYPTWNYTLFLLPPPITSNSGSTICFIQD